MAVSSCGKNDSNITETEEVENVVVQDGLCALEMSDIAKVKIKSFEIITDEIDSETCIAFTVQYTNLTDNEACFNDIGSRDGILHFSQDGVKLEPRRISKTSNIGFTVSKNNSVDGVVEFKDDNGNVVSSGTISVSK